MSLLQLLIISIIQGITEWLPISSSGHVLLAADYFDLEGRDEYLINAMAHVGTLGAVLLYFWRDVSRAVAGGLSLPAQAFRQAPLSQNQHLALMILASLPITIIAILAYEALLPEAAKGGLRSVWVVGSTSIVFGLALWWADSKGGHSRTQSDMTFGHAILIGATQAIAALLPGTSRSGITMTAARALGYSRTESARFSMLIGAPLLAAVGLYAFLQLSGSEDTGIATLTDGLIVAAFSFVSGFASIWGLMALLKRMSFLPFVIYRVILGLILLLYTPLLALI
ncbi:undecaprenyl-diphosphate phosphatase [Hyphomonas sp. FCG-A18]|uniref:undecaprenyl-diphosphate phosphatase n=1 Tax=Hyphomonas sp. FCG-A18 TaxID=3080019 RepID=UPI002B2ED74F|nr:undecaprenyl-diphosphate phosphatase [Hyphomonas sp. FCG-A18]